MIDPRAQLSEALDDLHRGPGQAVLIPEDFEDLDRAAAVTVTRDAGRFWAFVPGRCLPRGPAAAEQLGALGWRPDRQGEHGYCRQWAPDIPRDVIVRELIGFQREVLGALDGSWQIWPIF